MSANLPLRAGSYSERGKNSVNSAGRKQSDSEMGERLEQTIPRGGSADGKHTHEKTPLSPAMREMQMRAEHTHGRQTVAGKLRDHRTQK